MTFLLAHSRGVFSVVIGTKAGVKIIPRVVGQV